jgi:hypothetical protein
MSCFGEICAAAGLNFGLLYKKGLAVILFSDLDLDLGLF